MIRRLLAALFIGVWAAWAQTANWPGSLDNDANLMVAVNGYQSSLTQSISSSQTGSVTVASCAGLTFGTSGWVLITSGTEIFAFSACSGTTATIPSGGRGLDNTSGASHSSGATISAYIDAYHRNIDRLVIEAVESSLGSNLSKVLQVSNNLSDVGNAATARTNLGLTGIATAVGTSCGSSNSCAGNSSYAITKYASGIVTFSSSTTANQNGYPAFTGNNTYGCSITNANGHAYLGSVEVTSNNSFTAVSANSNSDPWFWFCLGT